MAKGKETVPDEIRPLEIRIYELGTMTPQDRERLMRRSRQDIGEVKREVLPIIDDVRARGDEAVIEYIKRFDGVKLNPESLRVSEADVAEAYERTNPFVLEAVRKQIELSKKFHEAQLENINMQW